MAHYSTEFSTRISYTTEEQRQWLLAQLEAQGDREEGSYCDYLDEPDKQALWIHGGEGGNINGVTELVANFQARFKIQAPWSISYAHTCSRPILDAFGGGTVVVYRGRIKYFNPDDLAQRWIARRRPVRQARSRRQHPHNTQAIS